MMVAQSFCWCTALAVALCATAGAQAQDSSPAPPAAPVPLAPLPSEAYSKSVIDAVQAFCNPTTMLSGRDQLLGLPEAEVVGAMVDVLKSSAGSDPLTRRLAYEMLLLRHGAKYGQAVEQLFAGIADETAQDHCIVALRGVEPEYRPQVVADVSSLFVSIAARVYSEDFATNHGDRRLIAESLRTLSVMRAMSNEAQSVVLGLISDAAVPQDVRGELVAAMLSTSSNEVLRGMLAKEGDVGMNVALLEGIGAHVMRVGNKVDPERREALVKYVARELRASDASVRLLAINKLPWVIGDDLYTTSEDGTRRLNDTWRKEFEQSATTDGDDGVRARAAEVLSLLEKLANP